MIAEAVTHFDGAGVKHFAFQMSPQAYPPEVPRWLAAQGLGASNNWVKMIHAPAPPPVIRTDLHIEQIGSDQADTFSEIVETAFEMPSVIRPWFNFLVGRAAWRHYLAFDGDTPVGCGALFIKNGIGWLGIGGTLPAARGKGAQGALIARRINDAIDLGCQWIITETGEETPGHRNPSYHNMVRTGFELVYPRPNYVRVK
jgi:GNAT superfamily N-acetyltransferase